MRIQRLNHSTYQHQYHIVWGTKYRRKYLKPYVKEVLLSVLEQELRKYPTLHMGICNVDDDHVHLQIEIPPNVTVSAVVQKLKTATSKALMKKFPFIRRMYVENSIWSVGYYSSTIGLNEAMVLRYIEYQGQQELPQPANLEFSWTPKETPDQA